MARDKDKSVNPATAALKSQKNAAIKKQKAAVAQQRTQRLAQRNPDRLQRQIDDLHSLRESSGGKLRPRDQQALEGLERDVRLIKKARESDPSFARQHARDQRRDDGGSSSLGKRRRGRDDARTRDDAGDDEGDDTDPEVRDIPMPRDTPPPMPRRRGPPDETGPPKPAVESKKTYSAAPQMRNLQQEAVNKFVPAAVAARNKSKAGPQRMLEPEEADALEEEERRRLDAEGLALGRELADEAEGDIAGAVNEAEAEARHEMLADEAGGAVADASANADTRLRQVEGEEALGARQDVYMDMRKAADEAEAEAVHRIMSDTGSGATRTADRRLHQVEMEEVDDEDLPTPAPSKPPPAPAPATHQPGEDKFSWD